MIFKKGYEINLCMIKKIDSMVSKIAYSFAKRGKFN